MTQTGHGGAACQLDATPPASDAARSRRERAATRGVRARRIGLLSCDEHVEGVEAAIVSGLASAMTLDFLFRASSTDGMQPVCTGVLTDQSVSNSEP